MCLTRKLGYATAACAWRVAQRFARRKHTSVDIYRCKHCTQWHLTHATTKRAKVAVVLKMRSAKA